MAGVGGPRGGPGGRWRAGEGGGAGVAVLGARPASALHFIYCAGGYQLR